VSDKDIIAICALAAWPVLAAVAYGVMKEVRPEWIEQGHDVLVILWPLCLVVAVPVGVVYALTWLGRGPVVLLRRRAERTKLPKATARERV
jgi:hypothetical protein